MKEKIKKFFSKDNLFILICTFLIAIFVFLCVIYHNKDVENYESKNKSNINLVDAEFNLNTSWHYDNSGNLVSDNLINQEDVVMTNPSGFVISGNLNDYVISAGTYTFSFYYAGNVNNAGSQLIVYNTNNERILDPVFYVSMNSYNSYTFTTNVSFYIYQYYINASGTYSKFMVNSGSSRIDYEPYGAIYYSEDNYADHYFDGYYDGRLSGYDDGYDEGHSVGYSEGYEDGLSSGGGFINENENLLLNYKDSKFYYNGTQIHNSTNLWTEFDVDSGFTYLELYDGEPFEHLDYIDVLYDTITIDKSLLYVLTNSVGPYAHIILYNNNNSVLELNYPYNSNTEMPFPIELYDTYTFNKIRVYNLNPNGVYGASGNKLFLSSSNASYNYLLGYNVGYDKGMENAQVIQSEYDTLNSEYNSLNSNYNNLLQQYNNLANNEYTFSELFWSISSVPFGVLASGFNVNVLGVNLAAIITGLFTALLIIWLIKKFLK